MRYSWVFSKPSPNLLRVRKIENSEIFARKASVKKQKSTFTIKMPAM